MKDVQSLQPTVVSGTEIAVRLPRRHIQYQDNKGYLLDVDQLPWAGKGYTLTRRRLDAGVNLGEVEHTTARGPSVKISHPLPAPGVELIEIRRR